MIKEGPFFSPQAARAAAQDAADESGRPQYIVVLKSCYFYTDEEPSYTGASPYYRLEDVVHPRG